MCLFFQKKGQSLVEYLVLVALIAVGTVGVVRVVGSNIAIQYENINRGIGSKNATQLQLQNTDSALLNRKDLSDFLQGTR